MSVFGLLYTYMVFVRGLIGTLLWHLLSASINYLILIRRPNQDDREWLVLNGNYLYKWAIFQLYYGENKLVKPVLRGHLCNKEKVVF
jgi:hypothetical protein